MRVEFVDFPASLRLLALLGVCQWIVTTVLWPSWDAGDGIGWIQTFLPRRWRNGSMFLWCSQLWHIHGLIGVPKNGTLWADSREWDSLVIFAILLVPSRPILPVGLEHLCFFFWGAFGAFEKSDHCGNWCFSGTPLRGAAEKNLWFARWDKLNVKVWDPVIFNWKGWGRTVWDQLLARVLISFYTHTFASLDGSNKPYV